MDVEGSICVVSLILASGNLLSVSKEEPDDGGLDLELPLLVSNPEDSVEVPDSVELWCMFRF